MSASRPFVLLSDGGERRESGTLVEAFQQALLAAPEKIYAILIRERVPNSKYPPASDDELTEILLSVRPLCQTHAIRLIVHSETALALSGVADGVHLNASGESIASVRAKLSPNSTLGYSAHSIDEAQRAVAEGADYVFLSPIFAPLSKHDERPPLGLETLQSASRLLPEQVVALGGISLENLQACRKVGAKKVAMISSVIGAKKPGEAMRLLSDAWK